MMKYNFIEIYYLKIKIYTYSEKAVLCSDYFYYDLFFYRYLKGIKENPIGSIIE
jgi:hypothetical protein